MVGIKSVSDLKGKSIAFGSTHSTSSFNFPVAMLIADGIDPVKDLDKIIIAGSHSASLAALAEGKVDAAAASYNSFGKAVKKGAIDPRFSEKIFSMEVDAVSEPFETAFGYHIVKLLEGEVTVKRPLEAVAGDIRYQLRNQAKQAELKRLLSEVKVKKH